MNKASRGEVDGRIRRWIMSSDKIKKAKMRCGASTIKTRNTQNQTPPTQQTLIFLKSNPNRNTNSWLERKSCKKSETYMDVTVAGDNTLFVLGRGRQWLFLKTVEQSRWVLKRECVKDDRKKLEARPPEGCKWIERNRLRWNRGRKMKAMEGTRR